MSLRLIIADDHQLLIDGLVSVLSEIPELEILKPVNDGQQLLFFLATNPVDLVILDLNMPHLDGIKTLEILRRQYPRLKVIILSNYSQPQLVEEVKKLGAQGYLLKNSPASKLKEAITAVANGGNYFEYFKTGKEESNAYFLDEFMKKYNLTKREVEIIQMIGKEYTSKQISDNLYISEFTVNTHRRNIMKKLAIKNIAGLLNFAQKYGLVSI